MRRTQKRQALDIIRQMEETHDEIKKYLDKDGIGLAMDLLGECQSAGISVGEMIEASEGDGCPTVALLEEYCELVYSIYEDLDKGKGVGANKAYKLLRQKLIKASNSLKNDIKTRFEAVFLPYKVSMWDSLESVWKAAHEDEDCDAYVIPIPYFDKNPDGSLGVMHDESGLYPDYVEVTKYDEYDFEARRPEMIYIHNPYDNINIVTSVHPFFYSDNLKKFTECLVYIPYYATTGGMSKSQSLCPAYINADYIVIQSAVHRKFFDARIPDGKFLVLGSPKFDSVIHKCRGVAEPPETWKEQMAGRKVYFYNTSIGGMLENTDAFLKKMRYVFDTFKGRDDVCLLWRPHPLLESTFDSMRALYKPQYEALKKEFLEEKVGIFDGTADIESSIALSDVYIGDAGTSVTALFGVAGKPLFIFNNNINTPPEKDDWRGEWIAPQFDLYGNDKYMISRNGQLWVAENNDYNYRFYMDLGYEYAYGGYYMRAVEIRGKIYVLPANARHILVIEGQKMRRVDLDGNTEDTGTFRGYYYNGKYIFLLPFKYPKLVRFEIETERILYMGGVSEFNVRNVNDELLFGGVAVYGDELVFASPEDDKFAFVDMETLKVRELESGAKSGGVACGMVPDGDELWLLPFNGMTITCWNPKTGALAEYGDVPPGFKSVEYPHEIEGEKRPFGNIAISRENGKENIVISPGWGNMYLSLDRQTGKMTEWKPPLEFKMRGKNAYFVASGMGGFLGCVSQGGAKRRIWYAPERKLYDIDIDTKECTEINIEMDYDELSAHHPGFSKFSEGLRYCMYEDAFNSLENFIDGKVTGNPFDREGQLAAYAEINANVDGTCGINVYNFVKGRIL